MNKIPYLSSDHCDGAHAQEENIRETRRLPLAGGAGLILCRACFRKEVTNWHMVQHVSYNDLPHWHLCHVVESGLGEFKEICRVYFDKYLNFPHDFDTLEDARRHAKIQMKTIYFYKYLAVPLGDGRD